jgi:hypothetical protein
MLKRAVIVIAAASKAAAASLFFMLGFGRNAFVGDISIAVGASRYAISPIATCVSVTVLVALLAMMTTGRLAK